MANLEDLENHVGTFRNGHVPDKSQTVDTKTALLGQKICPKLHYYVLNCSLNSSKNVRV